MSIIGSIIGLLIGALFSGLIIWIVGKLGWGIEVSGFGPAFVAALVIAVLNILVTWLLSVLGITFGAGHAIVLFTPFAIIEAPKEA